MNIAKKAISSVKNILKDSDRKTKLPDGMEYILFERQQARLCAQHALNMLLQYHYFSVEELAEIAHKLDQSENVVLREGGGRQNMHSMNMDDSGFFSVQVISEALLPFELELISTDHPEAATVKGNPLSAKAFVCNQDQHWFVLRRFGQQWFELNSLKNGPKLLSNLYLDLYINQLKTEGYSVFYVRGVLPESEADQVITIAPVVDNAAGVSTGSQHLSQPDIVVDTEETDRRNLEEAIRLSMGLEGKPSVERETRSCDRATVPALDAEDPGETPILEPVNADEVRKRREAFLKQFN